MVPALGVASAIGLAGCAAASLPTSGPLAVYTSPEGGMDALLEGTLHLRNGCLVITGDPGAWVPYFPAGSASWDGEVLRWNDRGYREGDQISIGGGEGDIGPDGYTPDGCAGIDAWVVSPLQEGSTR